MDRYRLRGLRSAVRAGGSGRVVAGPLCRIGAPHRPAAVHGHWSRCHRTRTGTRRHRD